MSNTSSHRSTAAPEFGPPRRRPCRSGRAAEAVVFALLAHGASRPRHRTLQASSPLALLSLLTVTLSAPRIAAQRMPREDVIEVASIAEGLCVSNVFQTNMVLQRDKPIAIWGWARQARKSRSRSGRRSTVDPRAGGSQLEGHAGRDANEHRTKRMVIKGGQATLTLDNILVGDVGCSADRATWSSSSPRSRTARSRSCRRTSPRSVS